jgi:ATP-dependent DNA helicase RecG
MTLDDLQSMRESVDMEFKKAAGVSGYGELPKDLWPSYSAMANTEGGDIYLGIEELKPSGELRPVHLPDIARLKQDIFNLANNRQKVSINLLRDSDVSEMLIAGCAVLRIHVPRASRQQRPVYVGENPLRGTYVRRNEGDFVCDEVTIKRMLAEQTEESRDSKILPHYTVDDLDANTIEAYRQLFASRTPTHPFVTKPLQEFLLAVNAWRRDRATGEEGLTLAGVLMFGSLNSILEAVPHYVVDYQERAEAKAELRWVDRVTTDGSWSGNLFDFYRRVFNKLTADLKVPFRNEGGVRQQLTPVHEALQEALVNTLIHADYSGRASILVVKRPDMFGFRNPGAMRVPIERAKLGSLSDCRNRLIQKMFQFVGAGDQAGSGVPRIYGVWKNESWREPIVHERREPEQTLFELRMASLLPHDVVASFEVKHGQNFSRLTHEDKLVVVSAAVERNIDHARACELTNQHPADVTKQLGRLSREGFLIAQGRGRGTFYWSSEVADFERGASYGLEGLGLTDSLGFAVSPSGLTANPTGLPSNPTGLTASLAGLERLRARVTAKYPRGLPGKLPEPEMSTLIVELLDGEFVAPQDLASALERSPAFLRASYIKPLLAKQLIEPQYADKPSHPQQAYRKRA